jgi:hypothetical protein
MQACAARSALVIVRSRSETAAIEAGSMIWPSMRRRS